MHGRVSSLFATAVIAASVVPSGSAQAQDNVTSKSVGPTLCLQGLVAGSHGGPAGLLAAIVGNPACALTVVSGALQAGVLIDECLVEQPPNPVCSQLDLSALDALVGSAHAAGPAAAQLPDFQVAAASIDALLASKVDRKATFAQVKSVVDALYKKEAYGTYLGSLVESYDLETKATHAEIRRRLSRCQHADAATAEVLCAGLAASFVAYASQSPSRSGDPAVESIGGAFLRAAKLVRSAAVNNGVPVRKLDASLRLLRDDFLANCRDGIGVPCESVQ